MAWKTVSVKLFRTPIILLALHAGFMLWVGYRWQSAIREYGLVAGPEGNYALTTVRWVDFLTYPAGKAVYETIVTSNSPTTQSFLSWLRADSFGDMGLRVLWPLLFTFGSLQWLLTGFIVDWTRRMLRKRTPVSSASP
jgi:hypothetical protein